jgi:hypothetical protein
VNDLPELDDEASALLAALREEERLPSPVEDRVWTRLAAEVEPAPRRRYLWLGLAAAAALVIAFVSLQGRSAADRPSEDRRDQAVFEAERDDAPAEATRRAPPAPAPVTTRDPSPPDDDDEAEPEPEPADPLPVATPDPVPPRAPTPTPTVSPRVSLAGELALLEDMRAALLAEDAGRALKIAGEHARKYPKGALTEERLGLRAVALCTLGRAEGTSAAATFLRDHPTSSLATKVRTACAAAEKSTAP